MIYVTQQSQIFLATQPVDFRKQMDGLIAYCHNQLQSQPRSGALFVFLNRSRTLLRILHYDGTGYWLATKRLSQGYFPALPKHPDTLGKIAAAQLMSLIKSAACTSVQHCVN